MDSSTDTRGISRCRNALSRPLQSSSAVLKRTSSPALKKLKKEQLISRFGPLYDAARIGGGLTLAAMYVPEDSYEQVTETVNGYLEVAHNYRRQHELNMWFVLATERPEQVDAVIASIEQATGLKVYNFPKQQEFYIGLWLHLSADGRHDTVPVPNAISAQSADQKPEQARHHELDNTDRRLISATQAGLAIECTPYQKLADSLGIMQQEVLLRLQNMLASGIIRRIGAVPNHYRLGLTANGMTVWNVTDDKIDALGELVGQLDFVSHCYQRPRHMPVWPYNLFAMVHGHDKDEVTNKVRQIESLLAEDCSAHETLFSSAILKKTGLRLAA